MLSLRNNLATLARRNIMLTSAKTFSAKNVEPSLGDIADVLKVNYTEEFNQNLTEAEK
jgi:hypothetical protein